MSLATTSALGTVRAVRRKRRLDTAVLVAVVLVVAALAWVGLLLTHSGHAAEPIAQPGHTSLLEAGSQHATHTGGHASQGVSADRTSSSGQARSPGPVAEPEALLLALTGWTLMVLAMMLPPAIPLLRVIRALTRRRRHPVLLTLTAAPSFTIVWIGVGVVFVLLDRSLARVPGLAPNAPYVAGAAVIAAGAYQFTPLKKACLAACRSPRSLALSTWTGQRPYTDVSLIAVRFGVVCVGCCWALMLLTFAVGAAAMAVMVVVSVVMALERLLPDVRPLVTLAGVAALVLGIAVLVRLVPAGLFGGAHL